MFSCIKIQFERCNFFKAQLKRRRKSTRLWCSGLGWLIQLGQLPFQPGNCYTKAFTIWGTSFNEQALEFFHWLCRILYFHSALRFCPHISLDFWPVALGLPQWLSGKESTRNAGNAGDQGSIPG